MDTTINTNDRAHKICITLPHTRDLCLERVAWGKIYELGSLKKSQASFGLCNRRIPLPRNQTEIGVRLTLCHLTLKAYITILLRYFKRHIYELCIYQAVAICSIVMTLTIYIH